LEQWTSHDVSIWISSLGDWSKGFGYEENFLQAGNELS